MQRCVAIEQELSEEIEGVWMGGLWWWADCPPWLLVWFWGLWEQGRARAWGLWEQIGVLVIRVGFCWLRCAVYCTSLLLHFRPCVAQVTASMRMKSQPELAKRRWRCAHTTQLDAVKMERVPQRGFTGNIINQWSIDSILPWWQVATHAFSSLTWLCCGYFQCHHLVLRLASCMLSKIHSHHSWSIDKSHIVVFFIKPPCYSLASSGHYYLAPPLVDSDWSLTWRSCHPVCFWEGSSLAWDRYMLFVQCPEWTLTLPM